MRFVGNLMLVTTCEFYHDDITVTSFIDKILLSDAATNLSKMNNMLFVFCEQMSLMQTKFRQFVSSIWQ